LAWLKGDNGLLPVITLAQTPSGTLGLTQNVQGSHALHFNVEQRFDGLLDFQLGSVGRNLEDELAFLFSQAEL